MASPPCDISNCERRARITWTAGDLSGDSVKRLALCAKCSRAAIAAICSGSTRVAGPAGGWAYVPSGEDGPSWPGEDGPSWGFVQVGDASVLAVRNVDISLL